MYQMHTGTRPGRPALLIALCGVALAGTLGLAWLQTKSARSLGSPVDLGQGLVVRPPLGWTQDPQRPNRFLETVRVGGERLVIERRIRFSYIRRGRIPNLFDAIQERLPQFATVESFASARIGPLRGIQVVGERQVPFGKTQQPGQEIFRLAFSPQGHELLIYYAPQREVTPGDLALLDAICDEVKLPHVDLSDNYDPEKLGVQLPEMPGVRRSGPDFPGVPTMYLQAETDGIPSWSIGIRRTWLTQGSPEQLLANRVGRNPRAQYRRIEIGDRLVLSVGPTERNHIYLIHDGPDQMAFVELAYSPQHDEAAHVAAEQLLEQLTFTQPFPLARTEAVQNGADLVERIAQPDALQAWAGERQINFLAETRAEGKGTLVLQRGPEDDGYGGIIEREYDREMERLRWLLDDDGFGFSLLFERGRLGANAEFELQQIRSGRTPRVESVETNQGRRRQRGFEVDQNFLCRPLEFAAAFWVARQQGGNWILTRNTPGTGQVHERLLQPLPNDQGRYRVLLLDAQKPTGRVLTFDADGNLLEDHGRRWLRVALSAEEYRRRVRGR